MKTNISKIAIFFLLGIILVSCGTMNPSKIAATSAKDKFCFEDVKQGLIYIMEKQGSEQPSLLVTDEVVRTVLNLRADRSIRISDGSWIYSIVVNKLKDGTYLTLFMKEKDTTKTLSVTSSVTKTNTTKKGFCSYKLNNCNAQ